MDEYCNYRCTVHIGWGDWFDEGANAEKTGYPCNRVHYVVSTVQ